jgi:4-hydroxymandelate oxidase
MRQQGQTARPKLPPREELVNAPEFEEPAKLALGAGAFATIAGGDRAVFDRITLRPRMMVPTLDLDLSVELFGEPHFTPIIVGPVADQRRYHAEGELATLRGASATKTAMVVSSRSSVPFRDLAAQAKAPIWFSTYADADARRQIEQAIAAGCKTICIATEPPAKINWKRIETIRHGLDVAVVIKGVMTVQEAKTALDQGARGIVVSDHGGADEDKIAPIDVLPSIAEAVSGKATILIDGAFRRGSDIVKALALGARGVLLARPIMWGLAAYGAAGVQSVLELLQNDVARNFGAMGASNLGRLTREMVRVHKR